MDRRNLLKYAAGGATLVAGVNFEPVSDRRDVIAAAPFTAQYRKE